MNVPTELEAVKKLDDPPDVVVKIEKQAVHNGGAGGCGHSPLCIIIIPFAIADAVFPEKLRIATVSEKGHETYHGVFRENEQFVQALALKDGLWRKIALLQLQQLGRNIVVEVAHAPTDAQGQPGEFEWSSLQKQVDLLTGYRALLAAGGEPDRRASIVREMLTHLRSEALPVARERLLDAGESTPVKAQALSQICDAKQPIGTDSERTELLKALDAKNPDAQLSAAALACFDAKQPESAAPFTARIIDAACAAESGDKAQALAGKIVIWGVPRDGAQGFDESGKPIRAAVEPFVARCAAEERRLFLRFVLRYRLEPAELGKLANSQDVTTATAVISTLDNADPAQRAILLGALERADSPLGAILNALTKNGHEPDADEAKALAGGFIVRRDSPGSRAELLARLGRTPEDQRAPAKARLGQKLTAASGEERSALHASLVMLGDSEHEAGAARALRGLCPELVEVRAKPAPSAAPSASGAPGGPGQSPLERAESACARKLPHEYWLVKSTPDLVAFVLARRGCKPAELLDISATDGKRPGPELGRVCKSDPR